MASIEFLGGVVSGRVLSQIDYCPDQRFVDDVGDPEAQLLADALHLDILGQDVAEDPLDASRPGRAGSAGSGARCPVLSWNVADEDGELGFVGALGSCSAGRRPDLMVAGLGALAIGHQGHLAVVVDEADPGQSLVRDRGLNFMAWK